MIVSRDLEPLPLEGYGGAVVSIGVFDGVHLGHQAILAANVARAQALGLRPTVVTFRGHPKRVLLGRAPRTLTSLEHRLELFRRAGISHTLALAFDESMRDTPAEVFVREILEQRLGARHYVLGFDSKFGRGREGGPDLLRALGQPVDVVPRVTVGERAVSSTAIREAVELGDLEGAGRMLGRPVAVLGTVVPGEQVGRRLGFPTANLDLDHELHPPTGVYACRARCVAQPGEAQTGVARPESPWSDAVANIGYRPTLAGERPESPRVEVHLLDFEGDLYGAALEVEFVSALRPEQRFEGPEALVEQIGLDVARAREVLAAKNPSPPV